MIELNRAILEILRKNNDDWTESIREGEQQGGIDLTQIISKNAQRFEEINTALNSYSLELL